MRYLDFEKQEKGYKEFRLTKENVFANIGKTIVYIRKCDVDNHRGMAFPRYGKLENMRYSYVYLSNGSEIDKRDVLECGIENFQG